MDAIRMILTHGEYASFAEAEPNAVTTATRSGCTSGSPVRRLAMRGGIPRCAMSGGGRC